MSEQINNEEEIRHLNRLYEVLSLVNQAMVRARSPEELFAEVCRIAVENGAFMLAWIGLYNPETHTVTPVAWAGGPLDFVRKVNVFADNQPRGRGPTSTAVREGIPVIINNILTDRHAFPWREALDEAGIRAAASFPFKVSVAVCGALSLYVNEIDFFKDKEIALLEEVSRDISFCLERMEEEKQRKRAEQELWHSEKKYRQLVELVQEGIWVIDFEARTTFVNSRMAEMLGYTVKEMTGRPVFSFVEECAVETLKTNIKRRKQGFREQYDFIFIRKDGSKVYTSLETSVMTDDNGNITGAMALVADITERKIAEMKVKTYEMKLRSLAAKLSLAEEQERRRIASDIHDHIGQSLAVAKMELRALRESLFSDTLRRNVDEIKDLIETTIQYTRSLTFEISPPILYELGFEAAVVWLGEQIIEKRGIRFCFKDDGQFKPLDDEIRVILFTAVREILMNIVKHAGAQKAFVTIQKQGKNLNIVIEDDGSGFDISKKDFNFSRIGGFGLFSVRERLVHMDGNMEIESRPGVGTIVTLEAPLSRRPGC